MPPRACHSSPPFATISGGPVRPWTTLPAIHYDRTLHIFHIIDVWQPNCRNHSIARVYVAAQHVLMSHASTSKVGGRTCADMHEVHHNRGTLTGEDALGAAKYNTACGSRCHAGTTALPSQHHASLHATRYHPPATCAPGLQVVRILLQMPALTAHMHCSAHTDRHWKACRHLSSPHHTTWPSNWHTLRP
jgi:hypothetical protein